MATSVIESSSTRPPSMADHELRRWAKKFDVAEDELRKAVQCWANGWDVHQDLNRRCKACCGVITAEICVPQG
jgi:hypothetical protein